jgi:ATP-dependent DNA helicase RecG
MRPEILFPLFAPIASLKGVGPKIEPLVEKLAGPLVRDLAFLAPASLVHRRRRAPDLRGLRRSAFSARQVRSSLAHPHL